mmetsp:Transcript_9694/g.14937  ORF Transcript_9694/g.14937 Transcript_9694/m.14937 type:complete len:101 (+) Transcript_9694:653-955(+)
MSFDDTSLSSSGCKDRNGAKSHNAGNTVGCDIIDVNNIEDILHLAKLDDTHISFALQLIENDEKANFVIDKIVKKIEQGALATVHLDQAQQVLNSLMEKV